MDSLTVSFDSADESSNSSTLLAEQQQQQAASVNHVYATLDINQGCCQELCHDQLVRLLQTEKSYLIKRVPCKRIPYPHLPEDEYTPLEDWRRKICQWSFRVIDHFHMDREVVTVGMNLFDRFLNLYSAKLSCVSISNNGSPSPFDCACTTCCTNIDSRSYQLAAMACLYMAIKLHRDGGASQDRRRAFRLTKFVDLSRGQFSEEDIVQMERVVLSTLSWHVSPPTPMTFVNYLLTLLPNSTVDHQSRHPGLVLHVLRELSRYLTELAVCLDVSDFAPSQVAFAAIFVSMELLTQGAMSIETRQDYCRSVYAMCQWTDAHKVIGQLRDKMFDSLWPEMILEDGSQADVSHPITLARDFGLLNIASLTRTSPMFKAQQQEHRSPPSSPRSKGHNEGYWEGSPVSTCR